MSSIRPTRCSFGRLILLVLPLLSVLSVFTAGAFAGDRFEPDQLLESRPPVPTDPDAPIAVAAETSVLVHWIDGRLVIRNMELDGRGEIEHKSAPLALALDERGHHVFSGDAKGNVRSLKISDSSEVWSTKLKGPVGSLYLSQGLRLVAAATPKTLTLLDLDGKILGTHGIGPSALKRGGRPVPIVVIVTGTSRVAVVESKQVRLVPIARTGFKKKGAPKVVKLPGSATCASRIPGSKGVLVGTTKGLVYVDAVRSTAKLLVKKDPSGPPVGLGAGTLVAAGIAKGRRRIVLFDPRKGFEPKGSVELEGTTGEHLVASSREHVFFVSRYGGKGAGAKVDCLDGTTGRVRGGVLPGGGSNPRILPNGTVSSLVWQEGERGAASSVSAWAWSVKQGPQLLGNHPGDLVAEDSVGFLVREKKALTLVSRAGGVGKQLTQPASADADYSLQHGRFVLWAKGDDYTVWDGVKDASLGTFAARSQNSVAVSPDGVRVVRLTESGELVCEQVGGEVVWTSKAPNAHDGLEVSATGRALNVIGHGVRAMETGELIFAAPGLARFSSDGLRLLQSQNDRDRAPATVYDVDTGNSLWRLPLAKAQARLRTSVELIAMDGEGRLLLVRNHGATRKGLWLYRRA